MAWPVIAGLFLLLCIFCSVCTAIYDPSTGKKLPEEGRWKRILETIGYFIPF